MTRERLPNRRAAETFDVSANGVRYRVTIGRFADGRLAEIFISNSKQGSHSDTNARDAAVLCSLALQYGAPLDTIRKALMRDAQGRASGVLGVALDMLAGAR